MAVALRKGTQREVAGAIVIGDGMTLDQDSSGLPRLNVTAADTSKPFHDLGTASTGSITPDFRDTYANKVVLAASGLTIDAPLGAEDGGSYMLVIRQDATGSRTVVWAAEYKFSNGQAPTLSTAANSIDIYTFLVEGSTIYVVGSNNFS